MIYWSIAYEAIVGAMVITVTLSIFQHGATAYYGAESYGDWYETARRPLPP